MHPSRRERGAFCDLFERLGPDAPTRCGGWRTTELAAHLHTREHRLDAAPGLLGRGPFAGYTAKLEAEAAQRPYGELVDELRAGPPRQWIGRYVPAGDIHEWYVHHEDVRRANGEPPRLDDELDDALWTALARWGKVLTRRAAVGVELVAHDGRRRTAKDAPESVVLRGRPGSSVASRPAPSRAPTRPWRGTTRPRSGSERSTLGHGQQRPRHPPAELLHRPDDRVLPRWVLQHRR